MTGVPFLAGVDVSTPADNPAGAIVLFGDQTVNADTAGSDGRNQLSDHLATALSTDEFGTTYPLRAGVLNQGSSSWGNKVLLPRVPNSRLPQNAYGVVDRGILAQTNARIVLLSAGSSDLLTCTATAAECATTVRTKLDALASQVQQYRADDALDYAVNVPTTSRTLKVYVATLPPFTGTYTAAQEAARQSVNAHILGSGGPANMEGYADGVVDFAAAVSSDGTSTAAAVNPENLTAGYPNNLYYQRLAAQYGTDADSADDVAGDPEPPVGDGTFPVAEWKFSEGTGTTAADTGTGTGSATAPVLHNAPLTDVTWSAGRQAESKAGTFNGTSSYADTGLPLNTAKSFTVAAWVRLANKTADRTILTRDASGYASLYLQYQKSTDRWLAQMPSATSGDVITWSNATSDEPAKAGVWTHVAVAYDAVDHSLSLYVNGKSQGGADEVSPFHEADKPTWIGRSGTTWFAGDIADVRVWTRAVHVAEIAAEAMPKMPAVNWQFEDQSSATTATDSSANAADGIFTGGVTWKNEGHPDPDGGSDSADVDRGAIALTGTDSGVSTRNRLRTDQSFTASAWVRLTRDTSYATVMGQAGVHASGFQLSFGGACKCWRFLLPTVDGTSPTSTVAQQSTVAPLNTWTHLTGVYDAAAGTAKLYVNGTEAGSAVVPPQTWTAANQFVVGRAWWNDGWRDYFAGDIDDVQVFQEPLTAKNVGELMREEPLTQQSDTTEE